MEEEEIEEENTSIDRARYDRQLRVWGEDAQEALEGAEVCVVGASAVGTEALKGLVLPGVGSVTVVDSARVNAADGGTNFFVDPVADCGRPRAEAVAARVAALNPRVRVRAVTCTAAALDDDAFWAPFSAVVATQLSTNEAAALAARLCRLGVPLVLARSRGFVGTLRVAAPDHIVVDARPDAAPPDLRIAAPFPELLAHCTRPPYADLAALSSADHAHVPFVVLLVQALLRWQKGHQKEGQEGRLLPRTPEEQAELRAELEALTRPGADETNFAEARRHLHCAWTPPTLPEGVRAVFADKRCVDPAEARDARDADFWVVAAALREFVAHEGGGALPLAGTLPDMVAHTADYVALQRVYRERAAADVAAVTRHANAVATRIGRTPPPARLVRRMCRAAATLTLVRYPSVSPRTGNVPPPPRADGEEDDVDDETRAWALLFDAAEAFAARCGRWPGDVADDAPECAQILAADTAALQADVVARLRALGYAEDAVSLEMVAEMFVDVLSRTHQGFDSQQQQRQGAIWRMRDALHVSGSGRARGAGGREARDAHVCAARQLRGVQRHRRHCHAVSSPARLNLPIVLCEKSVKERVSGAP